MDEHEQPAAMDGMIEHGLWAAIAEYEERFGTRDLIRYLSEEGRLRGFDVRPAKRRRGSSRRTHGRMEARP